MKLRFGYPSLFPLVLFIDWLFYQLMLHYYTSDFASYLGWLCKWRCCPVWGCVMKSKFGFKPELYWSELPALLSFGVLRLYEPLTAEEREFTDAFDMTKEGGCCWQVRQNTWREHFRSVIWILKDRYRHEKT